MSQMEELESRLQKELQGFDLEERKEHEIEDHISKIIEFCKTHPLDEKFDKELNNLIFELNYSLSHLLGRIEVLKVSSLMYFKDVLLNMHKRLAASSPVFLPSIKKLEDVLAKLYKEIMKVVRNEYSGYKGFLRRAGAGEIPEKERIEIDTLKKELGEIEKYTEQLNTEKVDEAVDKIGRFIPTLEDIEHNLSEIEKKHLTKIRNFYLFFHHMGLKRYGEVFSRILDRFSYWKEQEAGEEEKIRNSVAEIDEQIRMHIKEHFREIPSDPSLYRFLVQKLKVTKLHRVLYPASGGDVNRISTSIPQAAKIVGYDQLGSYLSGSFYLMKKRVPDAFFSVNDNSFDMVIVDNNVELSRNAKDIVPQFVRVVVPNSFFITPGPKYRGYFFPLSRYTSFREYEDAINVKPYAVSDDGKWVAYLITREIKSRIKGWKAA